MEAFIGTSGWEYDDWRGKFYPDGLARAKWLEYYARTFSSVEVNSTFYRLPPASDVKVWYDNSPHDFVISLKASRYITHMKKLHEVSEPVNKFLNVAKELEEKMGIILFQLPQNFARDDKRLKTLLKILDKGYRYSIEFRHKSWFDNGVYDILRAHETALCIYDLPGFSSPMVSTTDFTYVRFHGSTSLYSSSYSKQELKEWADHIRTLAGVRRVYIYFNNDAEGYSVENAKVMHGLFET